MSQGSAPNSLAARVAQIPWYHTIELPGGVVTPGANKSSLVLARLRLPASFAGKSVLDVGAWDGFYSFEAHRRGAARVLATDSFVWEGKTWGDTKRAGFDLAREALGLTDVVEAKLIDVMDLSEEALGERFDVVLFLGILYHLRDPIGALERASSVCREMLVIETETALNWLRYPASRVFPGSELNNDPSNWFSFNKAALLSLCRGFGFNEVRVVYQTPGWRSLVRAVLGAIGVARFRQTRLSRRIVVHASRVPVAPS